MPLIGLYRNEGLIALINKLNNVEKKVCINLLTKIDISLLIENPT